MSKISTKLRELGISLPTFDFGSGFSLILAKKNGEYVFTSGHDCRKGETLLHKGKLGKDLSIEQGYDASRQCIINILATLKSELGSLDKIENIIKMTGFINSAPGFNQQPYVLNGASELLVELFGEEGKHARSAIGVNELPFDTPVEVELIVQINENK